MCVAALHSTFCSLCFGRIFFFVVAQNEIADFFLGGWVGEVFEVVFFFEKGKGIKIKRFFMRRGRE